MKKLIEYPTQAINLVHKGQMLVLISNDVQKVANAILYIPSMAVSFVWSGSKTFFRKFSLEI